MGKLKSLGSKLLAGPYLIWMLLFTVVPLCLIIYNAFTNSDGKFTFKYVSAIAAPVNFKPLLLQFSDVTYSYDCLPLTGISAGGYSK